MAATLHRQRGAEAIDAARLATARVDVRVDDAGAHAVHADPFGRHFAREADGEHVERAFRRRVVHVLARRAEHCRARRHVDDRAACAAVRGRHPLHGFARANERAGHVSREDSRQACRVDLLDACLGLEDAGVVDERAQRTEVAIDGGEQALDVPLGRHVGLNGDGARPGAPDVANDGFRGVAVAPVVHADGVSAPGRETRRLGADPAASAGDEEGFVRHTVAALKGCATGARYKRPRRAVRRDARRGRGSTGVGSSYQISNS